MKLKKITQASIIVCLNLIAVAMFAASLQNIITTEEAPLYTETLSKMGSRGSEVKAIQEKLKERGLYNGSVDGIFGSATQAAVKKFQKQQGLTQDGIAGPATLKRLGITIGKLPAATQRAAGSAPESFFPLRPAQWRTCSA